MSEVRLIDANALKYKNLAEVNGKLTYVLTAEEIDNAPTVELFCAYLSDGEVRQPCVEAPCKYERPQGEWGKWIIAEIQCPNCFEYFETDCYSTEELNKCPNCGADMRKPNCVTCDHFGKCEGCEKGEEE